MAASDMLEPLSAGRARPKWIPHPAGTVHEKTVIPIPHQSSLQATISLVWGGCAKEEARVCLAPLVSIHRSGEQAR